MNNNFRKEFKYETQSFQEECVVGITGIFQQLGEEVPFTEIIAQHISQNRLHPKISQAKNIDIMMETGTGKTFTYIKTIFELGKLGHRKFILLVPSVAIREGSAAGFEDTKHHFKKIYADSKEREIALHVYESGKLDVIESFINNPDELSCLILTPASFSAKDNILNRPLEKDYFRSAKSYLELLKLIDPIVIMDEPHKFEGEKFKIYFQGFNNYYLRFGATFPLPDKKNDTIPLSNTAYILDSISAFRQCLVKRITVHTQEVVKAGQTLAAIDYTKKEIAVHNYVNGVFTEKKLLKAGQPFNGVLIRKINKTSVVLADGTILKPDFQFTEEAMRSMIADAVKVHFEKEVYLFNKGIKALSLFFIESVEHYRSMENPVVKTIFEEEYRKKRARIIADIKKKPKFKNYLKYLENDMDADGNLQIHKGYFSGDKGNKDEQIKRGVDEILRDKRKLLSFESPTRFVFSVWALQEGWDNPNVFTLCKLSNYGQEIAKLQQVGRGLRICVDQELQRQTVDCFDDNQDAFWEVNNLDVIVANQETDFVKGIQDEILSKSFLANEESFTAAQFYGIIKEKNNFDDAACLKLFKFLESKELFQSAGLDENNHEVYKKSPDFESRIKQLLDTPDTLPVPLAVKHIKALENIFASDMGNYITHAGKVKKQKIRIKDKHYEEFKCLWETINRNSLYFIKELTEERESQLCRSIAEKVGKLKLSKTFLQRTKTVIVPPKIDGELPFEVADATEYQHKVDYVTLVKQLAAESNAPWNFIVKIFGRLSEEFKATLSTNPAEFQREAAAIIKRELSGGILANINYFGIDGNIYPQGTMYDEQGKFRRELNGGALGQTQADRTEFPLTEEWIFEDVIEYDSNFEREIIVNDPHLKEITLFGKMPKLEIHTPLGKYNPDFCYAIEGANGKKVVLVVESKGYDTESAIPADEKGKIEYAKKYFDVLNERLEKEEVRVLYKTRINHTGLAALIKEVI